jgi:glycopeptide antibiotics resistance protein
MKRGQKEIPNENKVLWDNPVVMDNKLRRFIIIGTIVYTALVLYFMFLGFNRLEPKSDYNQYTFIFIPEGIPLRFPKLTMSWLYDFGNIAAFIPFGIIIPLLYRTRFRKFVTLFILVITFLEALQSFTFLGTFDVMDIISNTLGAIMGFVAYKIGFSSEITFKKLAASAVSILMLFIGVMTASETIDYVVHVNERIGPIEAINEISTNPPVTEKISTFSVQGEKIQPTLNLLSSMNGLSKEYQFDLGKENLWFMLILAFPTGKNIVVRL